MDDKTLQALTALAQKLGTTAEYLWGVLLRQAPITGALDLAVIAAWAAACVWLVRFVWRNTSGERPTWDDEIARTFAWIGTSVLCLLTALLGGVALPHAVTAIVAKQTKNEGRKWPDWRTAEPGKAIEHDRSDEQPRDTRTWRDGVR